MDGCIDGRMDATKLEVAQSAPSEGILDTSFLFPCSLAFDLLSYLFCWILHVEDF